ncbi:MAG: PSD1 domain-containing protein [Verrucomicrobiales bacterium]|nr:PSD1 domain-containing protein [Verrucomicrobiales bacterium]
MWGTGFAGGAETPDFARDVRPIFEEHCYRCHGPRRQESSLRLDERTAALQGGEHGAPLVPGKPEDSLLLAVIAGRHAEIGRMPKKSEPLPEAKVEVLRAWISNGASWPETVPGKGGEHSVHWAFTAPVRPPVPAGATSGSGRGGHAIDAFVQAKLKAEGLKPSPEADRVTLLRRLHFDLVGLPPTIEDVDRFLADQSEGAYERAVERLLASPHYGERWGRHWLDAARYADSDGFEKDKPRFIWMYRDWVVSALNRDLPYDRFLIEQIAGDLLPDADQDQRVATGFLRNAMLNEEGGVDPEQFRMEAMFDRMDAIGKSILGLTIQCGQCHNHKFDPLKQEEYYRLFSFLNNDHEASVVAYTPSEQMKVANLRRQMSDLEADLRHRHPDWEDRMAAWEATVAEEGTAWEVVPHINVGDNGERFYYYSDGSVRAASYAPTQWTARFEGTNRLARIGAFRFEQLTDPNLPCHGPGRSTRGMAALSEFKVTAVDASNPTNKVEVKFVSATADFEAPERLLEPEFQSEGRKRGGGDKRVTGPVRFAIDGNGDTAWGIDAGPGRRNVARQAVFIPEKPIEFPSGAILTFALQQNHGGDNSDDNQNHNLGRWRISATGSTNAMADKVPAGVRTILSIPRERRTPTQVAAVFSYWRTTVTEFREVNDRIEALWREWPDGSPTLTLAERRGAGPGDESRSTHILRRGDWLKPSDEVQAEVPAFLHAFPAGAPRNRLGLARWLADRASPTTARALVNRVWQQYFGTGLVETPEDLGVQAPPPSHPELLDWLAVEFMEPTQTLPGEPQATPWSLKHLHRLILHSATYRQTSRVTPELLSRDPYNRLLARGARLRVEAEVVRDTALAASGLLNPTIGGPPANPPAPAFLFQPPASYGPKVWNEETGPGRYRRALYTFRYRSVPYPVLQNFDAPNGDFSCVRRGRSNTPLQALTSLNEVLFMEAAQALARRMLELGESTPDQKRIAHGFRRVVGREPTDTELGQLNGFLERQRRRVEEGWISPQELAFGKPGIPGELPKGATPTLLAAYTALSRALLNLDETITKE